MAPPYACRRAGDTLQQLCLGRPLGLRCSPHGPHTPCNTSVEAVSVGGLFEAPAQVSQVSQAAFGCQAALGGSQLQVQRTGVRIVGPAALCRDPSRDPKLQRRDFCCTSAETGGRLLSRWTFPVDLFSLHVTCRAGWPVCGLLLGPGVSSQIWPA